MLSKTAFPPGGSLKVMPGTHASKEVIIMIRDVSNVKLRAMVTTAPPCGWDATDAGLKKMEKDVWRSGSNNLFDASTKINSPYWWISLPKYTPPFLTLFMDSNSMYKLQTR